MRLTTSIIEPVSLGVLSMLYMGIGWVNLIKLNWQLLVSFLSIHLPIKPKSKRAVTDFLSAMSIVSISTFKFSEVEIPSTVAMVKVLGKAFSHFDFQTLGAVVGVEVEMDLRTMSELWVFTGFCMSDVTVLESHVFHNNYMRATRVCSSLVALYKIFWILLGATGFKMSRAV